MDEEICMSDHDTFMHIHYKHDNEHFLPFVLHFQLLFRRISMEKSRNILYFHPFACFCMVGKAIKAFLSCVHIC